MSTATPDMLPIAGAARLLGMSASYARELERDGRFPVRVHRVGSWVRVARADIDAYLGLTPPPSPSIDAASILLAAEIIATRTKLEYLLAHTIDAPAPAPPAVRGAGDEAGEEDRDAA